MTRLRHYLTQRKVCAVNAATRRQRKLPNCLAVSVVEQTVGHRMEISNQNQFRQHVYLPIIECVIPELDARFSAQATTVMLGVQALSPRSETFLDETYLNGFAELYRGDTEDLGHEVYQLKRLLAGSENSSHQFDISDMLGYSEVSDIYGTVQISVCVTVSYFVHRLSAAGDVCCVRAQLFKP